MTRVDFYILHGTTLASERDSFACRLVNKALGLGTEIFLAAESSVHARSLGDLLQQDATPFSLDDSTHASVSIAEAARPGEHSECLINLSNEVPRCAARFERICEIVVFDSTLHAATQENFRFYRDRGFPLRTYELNTGVAQQPSANKASVPA